MQQVTIDRLGGATKNIRPFAGFRAIVRKYAEIKIPKSYQTDLACDADLIYEYKPARFVWAARETGSDIYPGNDALAATRLAAHLKIRGGECHLFCYDENIVRPGANEPDLFEVGPQAAIEFLKDAWEESQRALSPLRDNQRQKEEI